jgi:GrpB-like predicted nucleotidyltransferase (UPF0157 family)/predicted nucleotidyltransferase
MTDPVVVVDYDPESPRRFQLLRQRLLEALDGLPADVEHVGSTAVPGLAAKPVIDIDVVVRSTDDVPGAIERLKSVGYQHQGDQGVPGREAFNWPPGDERHHLYIVVRGSPAYQRHVLIRDYLRAHPDEARTYGELKKNLAEAYRFDRAAYTEAKDAFTDRIFSMAIEAQEGRSVTPRWRDLQAERLEEAVDAIGSVDGVVGVVVAGGVGRGEPWPMSDIDLVPIVREGSGALDEIGGLQASLVDWWAASGSPQTLDVGWLAFTEVEVRRAVEYEPGEAANLLGEPRWLHGLDKVYGGYGRADPDGLAQAFAMWATAIRFDPAVRQRRAAQALAGVEKSKRLLAGAVGRGDLVGASHQLRTAARDARLIHVERWSERLGSLGREWTKFERLAAKHGEENLAARLADLAGANIAETTRRAVHAPVWLQERIEIAFEARLLVGERVSEAESRRDQIAAFAHLVLGRGLPRQQDWLGVPDPDLARKQSELDDLVPSDNETC